jgi:hypothetical protein
MWDSEFFEVRPMWGNTQPANVHSSGDVSDMIGNVLQNAPELSLTEVTDFEFPAFLTQKFTVVSACEETETERKTKNFSNNPAFQMFGDERPWEEFAFESLIGGVTSQCKDAGIFSSEETGKFWSLHFSLKGSPYTDPTFRADAQAIIGHGEGAYNHQNTREIDWQRPSVLFKTSDIKLYDGICARDINQGGLGDCYLMSAIASLAEFPDRLQRIFAQTESNPSGVYLVAFCVNGIWTPVVIDDLFPCRSLSKSPLFAFSTTNEIWVMLLEKAYAKVYGGFANIDGGLVREALKDLTGAPTETIFNGNTPEELVWKKIRTAMTQGYILGAQSKESPTGSGDARDPKTGLSFGHAYTLLGGFEIENISGGEKRIVHVHESSKPGNERIIKLRNPWGKGEWNGDWNDTSYKWTPGLKRELGVTVEDDGIFFMPFKEFLQYFNDFQVCYFRDHYRYNAQKFTSSPSEVSTIRFTVKEAGNIFLTINQTKAECFPQARHYMYTPVSMIVAKVSSGETLYVGSVQKAANEAWFEAYYPPGEYVAIIQTPWKSFVHSFVLAAYCAQEIHFIKETRSREQAEATIVDILLERALLGANKFLNYGSQGHPTIKYDNVSSKDGFGYWVFLNDSQTHALEATVIIDCFEKAQLLGEYRGNGRPVVRVGPGERKIVAYGPENLSPGADVMRVSASLMALFRPANPSYGSKSMNNIDPQMFAPKAENYQPKAQRGGIQFTAPSNYQPTQISEPTPYSNYTAPQISQPTPISNYQPTISSNYQPTPISNYQPTISSNYQPTPISNYQPSSISSNYQPTPISNYQPSSITSNYQPSSISSNYQPSTISSNYQPAPLSNYQPSPISSYQPGLSSEEQEFARIRSNGKKVPKLYCGQQVGISCFIEVNPDGINYLYENTSSSYELFEEIEYSLENCYFDGLPGQHLSISAVPGEVFVVKLKRIDSNQDFHSIVMSQTSSVELCP